MTVEGCLVRGDPHDGIGLYPYYGGLAAEPGCVVRDAVESEDEEVATDLRDRLATEFKLFSGLGDEPPFGELEDDAGVPTLDAVARFRTRPCQKLAHLADGQIDRMTAPHRTNIRFGIEKVCVFRENGRIHVNVISG